jgi:hypothetical protein
MRDADDRKHPGSSTASRLSSACAAAIKRRVEPRRKASVVSQPESRYSFAGAKKDGKKVVDYIDRAQYRMQSRAMHCRAMHCKVMDWAMTAKGDRDAFGFDWCSDYCRHRRHLLLGDRQVCQGSPVGAATQASRDPDLSRGDPATDSASSRRLYLGAFACEPATPLCVADEVMEWNRAIGDQSIIRRSFGSASFCAWRRSLSICGPMISHGVRRRLRDEGRALRDSRRGLSAG